MPQARTLCVVEKATHEPLAELPCITEAELQDATARAKKQGRQWSSLTVEQRLKCFSALRRRIADSALELATLLSRENGKPRHEALLHEVVPLLSAIDWLLDAAPTEQAEQCLTPRWLKHRSHQIRSRPHGTIAVISPFNFPLLISGFDSLAALATGCRVLLKPSEHCPLAVQRFVKLAHESGISEDALILVLGDAETGEQLVAADVDGVVFTGSHDNGRKVARTCAERLRPYTLELGGNCPLLVLDDADLERTAMAIAFGALSNSGQSCLAVGRVLVPRNLERKLADALEGIVGKLVQGDPAKGPVDLGALTTHAQLERCRYHVTQAISGGASLRLGGKVCDRSGNFFLPTILTGVSSSSAIYREETFGPVVSLVPYDREESIIELLNDDPFGLAAYVFGRDLERARAQAEKLDYGHVVVDHVLLTYICPEVPLAGLRKSGIGTVHGREGLQAFSRPRVVATPKLRLPTQLEFLLGDPARAESIAKAFLSTTGTLSKLTSLFRN